MAKQEVQLPSTKVGRKRLLKLATLLEKDAKNKKGIKFALSTWGAAKGKTPSVDCGTQACAMGLAALSGAFKRDGLTIDGPSEDRGVFIIVPRMPASNTWHGFEYGLSAAEILFSISENEANWLFMPQRYRGLPKKGAQGERTVAKRIRDFVAGRTRPRERAW